MFEAEHIQAVIAYGFFAAVMIAFLERIILLIPSYVIFITMGNVLVISWTDLILIILFSAIGSTVGAALWFGAGRWLGPIRCRNFMARYQKWLFFSVERYDDLFERFKSNSIIVILVSQTIPTVRIFISLPAGIIGMPIVTYMGSMFMGCLIWNGSLIIGGVLTQYSDVSTPLLIAGIIGLILVIEGLAFVLAQKSGLLNKAIKSEET